VKVELSEEADEQVREIDAWWRENRRAAPDLFTDELDDALLALGETPTLGVTYQADDRTVRRLLLRRTHYHLTLCRRPSACTSWQSGAPSAAERRGCSRPIDDEHRAVGAAG
jgi:plasmid stabilization system protein ParE